MAQGQRAAQAVALNPELLHALAALRQAGDQVTVTSGVRSYAQQAALYQRYVDSGFNPQYIAAKPGMSDHERGNAIDLLINGRPAATYGNQFLARFGLDAPVPGDAVHVTALGGPGQQATGSSASTRTGTGGTATQAQIAGLIFSTSLKAFQRAGIPNAAERALELVSVSNAESGLNPNARNASSGAGGLFQLSSSGYVNKANQLGGVFDPMANLQAILPNYASYFQSHPNAAPGDAGRDVELSGQGSGFYASSLPLAQKLVGMHANLPPGQSAAPGVPGVPASPVAPPPPPDPSQGIAMALLGLARSGNSGPLQSLLAKAS